MRTILLIFLILITVETSAKSTGSNDFLFDYGKAQEALEEFSKERINDIRLIGHGDGDELFFSASVSREVKNFCQIEYDRIFQLNSKNNKFVELWNSEKKIGEVFDNINHTSLVYLLDGDKNPLDLHKCAPLVHLIKSKPIKANKGSLYNRLLRSDNFLVIHSDGKPGIFIFSPLFSGIIGSLLIPEERYSILDAEISVDGTLVTILLDEVRQLSCLSEYDIESNVLVFKKCSTPKNPYASLYKENGEVYIKMKNGSDSNSKRSLRNLRSEIKIIKH